MPKQWQHSNVKSTREREMGDNKRKAVISMGSCILWLFCCLQNQQKFGAVKKEIIDAKKGKFAK